MAEIILNDILISNENIKSNKNGAIITNDVENSAEGKYSHASGRGTTADNDYQTSIGKYNIGQKGTIFEIGIGNSKTVRKNALEVYNDGKIKAPDSELELTITYVNDGGTEQTITYYVIGRKKESGSN